MKDAQYVLKNILILQKNLLDYLNLHIGDKYDYSESDMNKRNEKGYIKIICPIHGEFWQRPSNHINGRGCPYCVNKKEILFYKQFKKLFPSITIECQKHFDWLGRQSLDFYLPEYNIAIEYQGIQHFKKNNLFKEDFIKQYERDIRKLKLCNDNNIKLIYFTFDNNKKTFLGNKIYNIVLELKEILV